MKIIDRIIIKAVKNKFIWSLLNPFIVAADYIMAIRKKIRLPYTNWSKFNNLFIELTVLNGPFRGMQYPDFKSVGSALYPKLLGSYEKELHNEIEKFISSDYTELIDVGCAEGYYAVGFALKNKNLKVYAYDIDKEARELCERMAILNNVKDRISIHSQLDEIELSTFKFKERGLVICDTEGFEKKIFTPISIPNLKNCDLLIETHDFIDLDISSKLCELFSDTHYISVIQSVDDVQKVKYHNYPLLESFSPIEKKLILSEHRSSIMEWLILRSKNN
jgi:hypothetical protein